MMKYSSDYLSREETRELNKRHENCKRLRGNSWVFDNAPNEVTLISYDKVIAKWKQGAKPHPQLWIVWDAFECSATTSRHLSMFIREYTNGCVSFQDCKTFITDAEIYEIKQINGIVIVCC